MNNRSLFYLVIVFICFLALQNVLVFIQIDRLTKQGAIANVPVVGADVGFCLNERPSLVDLCNFTAFEGQEYYCQINGTDPEGGNVSYYSFFDDFTLFNITPEGIIDFTPNATQQGNYSMHIVIVDEAGCPNSVHSSGFIFEVINVNFPPVLLMPIPNQTWRQDTSITPFDLDSYFWDPDDDPLNYTWSMLNFIDISINGLNEITLVPIAGWYGTEYITFIAYDPYMLNATSNDIKLTVTQYSVPSPVTPPSGGGGGGGGSMPSCIPEWYCKPWDPCQPDGFQTRVCFDLHNCTSEFGKPNTTQPCNFVSTCYDGFQGPDEEGIDCGGPCPPCGNCYDLICNNNEDCTRGLTDEPDCGGPCMPCKVATNESCYDGICNNDEDCTRGLSEEPDCGGPCLSCLKMKELQKPASSRGRLFTYILIGLLFLLFLLFLILMSRKYKWFIPIFAKRRKKKQELVLEAKYTETILEKLIKLEKRIKRLSREELLREFSLICIDYFIALFKYDHQFTYEEIIENLRTQSIDPDMKNLLVGFFKKASELSFSQKKGTKQEVKDLIAELRGIVLMTSVEQELPEDQAQKAIVVSQGQVDRILSRVAEAGDALKHDKINAAYDIYLEIMGEYRKLSETAKKHVTDFITNLYEDIKKKREQVK